MSYAFELDESVATAAVRVMTEELDGALTALTTVMTDDPPEAVHDCRKRCKKVRAVARLVRPALGNSYGEINRMARDAARELSDLRDASALTKTFDSFRGDGEPFDHVAGGLAASAAGTEHSLSPDLPAVQTALRELERLHDHLDEVTFDETGWDAIADGLRRTYRRGRRAMAVALDDGTPEHFHEWRKRVKYTRHHMELLGPTAPAVLDPLESAFHDLSDLLGDAHDLAVIRDDVAAGSDAAVAMRLREAQADLEHRALALGRALYAESPKRFTERLATYWTTAR